MKVNESYYKPCRRFESKDVQEFLNYYGEYVLNSGMTSLSICCTKEENEDTFNCYFMKGNPGDLSTFEEYQKRYMPNVKSTTDYIAYKIHNTAAEYALDLAILKKISADDLRKVVLTCARRFCLYEVISGMKADKKSNIITIKGNVPTNAPHPDFGITWRWLIIDSAIMTEELYEELQREINQNIQNGYDQNSRFEIVEEGSRSLSIKKSAFK